MTATTTRSRINTPTPTRAALRHPTTRPASGRNVDGANALQIGYADPDIDESYAASPTRLIDPSPAVEPDGEADGSATSPVALPRASLIVLVGGPGHRGRPRRARAQHEDQREFVRAGQPALAAVPARCPGAAARPAAGRSASRPATSARKPPDSGSCRPAPRRFLTLPTGKVVGEPKPASGNPAGSAPQPTATRGGSRAALRRWDSRDEPSSPVVPRRRTRARAAPRRRPRQAPARRGPLRRPRPAPPNPAGRMRPVPPVQVVRRGRSRGSGRTAEVGPGGSGRTAEVGPGGPGRTAEVRSGGSGRTAEVVPEFTPTAQARSRGSSRTAEARSNRLTEARGHRPRGRTLGETPRPGERPRLQVVSDVTDVTDVTDVDDADAADQPDPPAPRPGAGPQRPGRPGRPRPRPGRRRPLAGCAPGCRRPRAGRPDPPAAAEHGADPGAVPGHRRAAGRVAVHRRRRR